MRKLSLLAAIVIATACSGGDGGTGPNQSDDVEIFVSRTTFELVKGETGTISAHVSGSSNTKINYSSDDNGVATVSSAGLIRAIAPGTATITVEADASSDAVDFVYVTVLPAVTVTVAPSTFSLGVGQSVQMAVVVSGSPNQSVIWSSSPQGIISVSSTGLITALSAGTATVRATSAADTSASGTATITVTSSGGATVLTSGQTVLVNGTTGSSKFYTISVPAGATQLRVTTTGSNGDADLGVNFGPFTSANPTCVSETSTSNEICTITNPTAGTWFIEVYAYEAYSSLQLTATVTTGGGANAGLTVSLNPSSLTIGRGQTATTNVTVGRTGGYTGSVTLTFTNAPAGVSGSFNPSTLTSSQTTSVLTLTASSTATIGTANTTVTASGSGVVSTAAGLAATVTAVSGGTLCSKAYTFPAPAAGQTSQWYALEFPTGFEIQFERYTSNGGGILVRNRNTSSAKLEVHYAWRVGAPPNTTTDTRTAILNANTSDPDSHYHEFDNQPVTGTIYYDVRSVYRNSNFSTAYCQ